MIFFKIWEIRGSQKLKVHRIPFFEMITRSSKLTIKKPVPCWWKNTYLSRINLFVRCISQTHTAGKLSIQNMRTLEHWRNWTTLPIVVTIMENVLRRIPPTKTRKRSHQYAIPSTPTVLISGANIVLANVTLHLSSNEILISCWFKDKREKKVNFFIA